MSDLQQQYNRYKSQIQDLELKINELESDAEEHRLVLETLNNTDKSRQCKKMVGSVLVDKTVGEVIPALEETRDALLKAIKTLSDDLDKTRKLMDKWKVDNNVKIVQ